MKVKLFGCFYSFVKQHVSTIRWKSSSDFFNNSLKIIKENSRLHWYRNKFKIKMTYL